MICTQVTQIKHSTVGSSFSVSFSAEPTPNDLEILRVMREWFMRWNNSGVSFTKADTPQTDCYVSDLCKHYGDKQICGRCRNRNLFCEAEPQPRCPKCGKRGYIRSLESMGVKLKVFDEYKWKCTNCNKYFKEEPKDEQTDCSWK